MVLDGSVNSVVVAGITFACVELYVCFCVVLVGLVICGILWFVLTFVYLCGVCLVVGISVLWLFWVWFECLMLLWLVCGGVGFALGFCF